MAKRSSRPKTRTLPKAKSTKDSYELPADLDFEKLKYIGRGVGALTRHAEARRRMVLLEPDVAQAFPTAQDVNEALRTVINAAQHLREQERRKRRASA